MKLITGLMCAGALLLGTLTATAQPNCKLRADKVVYLYPEGQNSDKGLPEAEGPLASNGNTADMESIAENGNISYMGDNARMELYFPKKPNGQMVIVCPGGGYWITSSWNEGLYVADWMLSENITVCVVEYRMPNCNWNIPLQDIQNAFRYCRAHAQEWGVNQIGVMGFSAGGHLAASTSTLFVDEITRPDFSILVYPLITMNKTATHMGTRTNLIGKDEKWDNRDVMLKDFEEAQKMKHELERRYSLEAQVTKDTPSTYLIHCTDDTVVPVINSVNYYWSLKQHNVPVEFHIYPTGGHGWGFSAEKFVGKGNDRFAYARSEFETSLSRWLESLRK